MSANGRTADDILPCLRLSSAALGPLAAFRTWQATLPHYRINLAPGARIDDFHMEAAAWLLDPIVLTVGQTSSSSVDRTSEGTKDGYNNFVFMVFSEGRWAGDADGRPFEFGDGEMIALDTARPTLGLATDSRYVMINVPRRAIAELVPTIPDLHGHVFRSSSGRLLADHLTALGRYLPTMRCAEVERVTRATLGLTAAAIGELLADNPVDETTMSSAIRVRVERHIERNLSRTDLTPGSISKELGIARSTLYRAFVPLGGVSACILERRLETGRAILFHPEDHRSIGEIADVLGFESAATFSKAFHRRFGCSPREARATGATRFSLNGRMLFEFWREILAPTDVPDGRASAKDAPARAAPPPS